MKLFRSGIIVYFSFLILSCNNSTKTKPPLTASDSLKATIQVLEGALKQYPDSVAIRYKLAEALANNSQFKPALAQIDSLILRDSLNAVFWYQRGILQEKNGDTADAIGSLKASVLRAPMFLEPALELTFLLANREDPGALKLADEIIRHIENPQAVTRARFLKGVYYSNVNDPVNAEKQFDECIVHDYTFLDAYIEKAIIQYDQKKYDEALKTLQRANNVSNSFTDAYFWMGRCYEAKGNKEMAVDNYKKTLGLDPEYHEAAEALKRLK